MEQLSKSIFGILLVLWVSCVSAQDWATVYYESGAYVLRSGKNVSGVVYGYFSDEISENGWGKLFIESNGTYPANIQMFAAGYLEGVITQERISNYHTNFMANQFGDSLPPPPELLQFANENFAWTVKTAEANQDTDNYWWHVARVLDQFEGLYAGYNAASSAKMNLTDLLLINLSGDLDDLQSVFPSSEEQKSRKDWMEWSAREAADRIDKRGRCSVLIKVTSDLSDLFIAHTTWGSYWTMQRIWKTYNLNIPTSNSSGISFSGYPGMLVSFDDYFILKDTNLVVTETTNTVLNFTAYNNKITTQSVMYWIRAFVASRKATTGETWMDTFAKYNSGTYNNQWIVVDYKLFSAGKPIMPNTLWIMEQMPGAVYKQDVSNILQYGYWPSYNRPYFAEVYEAFGFPYCLSKYGDVFSYELNPRANIFRRDQGQVESLDDMMAIMQYNNWKTDPLSNGYPGDAISSRYDLKGGPDAPPVMDFGLGAHGGIDSKLTNSVLAANNQAMVISGPTHQGPSCPPFSWADWSNITHVGVPEFFNFTWITV